MDAQNTTWDPVENPWLRALTFGLVGALNPQMAQALPQVGLQMQKRQEDRQAAQEVAQFWQAFNQAASQGPEAIQTFMSSPAVTGLKTKGAQQIVGQLSAQLAGGRIKRAEEQAERQQTLEQMQKVIGQYPELGQDPSIMIYATTGDEKLAKLFSEAAKRGDPMELFKGLPAETKLGAGLLQGPEGEPIDPRTLMSNPALLLQAQRLGRLEANRSFGPRQAEVFDVLQAKGIDPYLATPGERAAALGEVYGRKERQAATAASAYGRAMGTALAKHEASWNLPVFPAKEGIVVYDTQEKVFRPDPVSPRQIAESGGRLVALSPKQGETLMESLTLADTLESFRPTLNEVLGTKLGENLLKGGMLTLESELGVNPQAARLQALSGLRLAIAKIIQGDSRVSDKDVQAIMGFTVQPWDTKEVANQKLDDILSYIRSYEQRLIGRKAPPPTGRVLTAEEKQEVSTWLASGSGTIPDSIRHLIPTVPGRNRPPTPLNAPVPPGGEWKTGPGGLKYYVEPR